MAIWADSITELHCKALEPYRCVHLNLFCFIYFLLLSREEIAFLKGPKINLMTL